MTVIIVPANRLCHSPTNVRRTSDATWTSYGKRAPKGAKARKLWLTATTRTPSDRSRATTSQYTQVP